MHYKLFLSLATIPTLAVSMVTMMLLASQVAAVEVISSRKNPIDRFLSLNQLASCELPTLAKPQLSGFRHPHQGILVASSQLSVDDGTFLDFSAAESDAAVTLFGCDCPACIGALRQLRTQPRLLNGTSQGGGHCWTSLQRRGLSQKIQPVLEGLEAAETGLEINQPY